MEQLKLLMFPENIGYSLEVSIFFQVTIPTLQTLPHLVSSNQFHPEQDFRGFGFISARLEQSCIIQADKTN